MHLPLPSHPYEMKGVCGDSKKKHTHTQKVREKTSKAKTMDPDQTIQYRCRKEVYHRKARFSNKPDVPVDGGEDRLDDDDDDDDTTRFRLLLLADDENNGTDESDCDAVVLLLLVVRRGCSC